MAFQPLNAQQMLNAGGQPSPGENPAALARLLGNIPDQPTVFDPTSSPEAQSLGNPMSMSQEPVPEQQIQAPGALTDGEQIEAMTQQYLQQMQEYARASEEAQWKTSNQLTR